MYPERVVIRVMSKWHPDGECWISDYSIGNHGYAQIGWKNGDRNVTTTAHRVAWWAANRQPIEAGMTVDHICRVRACVNPLHLRLLTNHENASDNGWSKRRTARETGDLHKCGKPLVISPGGWVYCRSCRNAKQRAKRAK